MSDITGVVILNKPKGYTSQDAIRVVRGILKAEKVGHTGTLDPDATGVLPVCVGKATKIAEMIMAADKVYKAHLVFGSETDTQDASGKVTRTFSYTYDEEAARKAALSFVGKLSQTPPMYSAIKHHGQKLYDLARAGVEIERPVREVEVYSLEVLDVDETGMTIRCHCSKGTYIRTLCEDIGKKLGYGAYMESLCREKTGPYSLEDAYTLEELEELAREGNTKACIQDLNSLFASLPVVRVPREDEAYLESGNYLTYPSEEVGGNIGDLCRMQTQDGRLLALYRISETARRGGKDCKRLRAYKMFI